MKPKKLNNHLEEKPMKNKHLFEWLESLFVKKLKNLKYI